LILIIPQFIPLLKESRYNKNRFIDGFPVLFPAIFPVTFPVTLSLDK
jgi:hypothetical protein